MRSRSILVVLAATFAAACTDGALAPKDARLSAPYIKPAAAITPTANSACTVRWASGVNGSWFDATKWSPSGVPSATSSVCINAAGTYIVTLDPPVDATPVSILALTIGASGATPSLRTDGTSAIMNIAQGILVNANATIDLRSFTGTTLNVAGTLTNHGTFSATATCGNCGSAHAVSADIINDGTFSSAATITLSKSNGQYQNTGTFSMINDGDIIVPATATAATFSQEGGVITGSGNFPNLTMRAGTFTMVGGKARTRQTNNLKPIVMLEGAKLSLTASATDTAVIGVLATNGNRSINGNISGRTTLWLGGPTDGNPHSIDFDGDVTNSGTIKMVWQVDAPGSGVLSIGGTGRLTNAGTIDQSLNSGSGPTFHYLLDVTNNGLFNISGVSYAVFEKPNGQYVNAGSITIGELSNVASLTVRGSVLRNTGTISGGNVVVDGGRLFGSGTSLTRLKPDNGGVIEPGHPIGAFTAYAFNPTTTGSLRIELGGEEAGIGYDRLVVTGTRFLQGSLDIVEANGFQAGKCGQSFDVFVHPASSGGYGTFNTVSGLTFAGGRALRVVYLNGNASAPGVVRLVGYDGGKKICVGPTSVDITEGVQGVQYAVVLDHAPTAAVIVNATPNAQVTTSPSSLTFTAANWQVPQFFTVTAVDDAAQEGPHTGTVTHAVTTTDATYQGLTLSPLTANITDNDLNLPPVAGSDAAQTSEDTPITINVLANDSDPEGATLRVSNVSQPAHGTAQIAAAGTAVLYTPADNYSGPDQFTYTLSDGTTGTATGRVSVTVTAVQDAPTAGADQASVRSARDIVISVLANDADIDADALTVTSRTNPAHGTATINGGQTITYRSSNGYVGPDLFTYTVSDGQGGTASATVSITVLSATANTPPIAVADQGSRGTSTGLVRVMVLDNDSDPDGDAIRLTSVSRGAAGIAIITGRSLLYTITNKFAGQDQLTYTITDALGATATATVTISWPPATPEVDIQIASVSMGGVMLRNARGTEALEMIMGSNFRVPGTLLSNFTAEFEVPENAITVGRIRPGQAFGVDSLLEVAPNCSLIKTAGRPTRYRCTVENDFNKPFVYQQVHYLLPRGAERHTASLRAYSTTTVDPYPDNNQTTVQAPQMCNGGTFPTRFWCSVR